MLAHVLLAKSPEDLLGQAVQLVDASASWAVVPKGRWETGEQYRERMKVPRRTLYRLVRYRFKPPVEIQWGESGRMIALRSNEIFDAWVRSMREGAGSGQVS